MGALCQADAEMRLAAQQPRGSKERRAHLESAAGWYRKAAGSLRQAEEKAYAYDALAAIYSTANLNEPAQAEPAVRQLIALAPGEVEPILLRGIPMLEEAAIAAVMQWRFAPAVIDGKPVPVRMVVTNSFTLQQK